MANNHDEVLQLYKDPMKAFAHLFLDGTNDQFVEIGREWQQRIVKGKELKDSTCFALQGLIEFVYSERFNEYCYLFDQDPIRVRRAMLEKLGGEEKECPKCKRVGRVVYNFGFRKIGNRLFIQSWCSGCRNKKWL